MKHRDRWKIYGGTVSDYIVLRNGIVIVAEADQWFEHTQQGASVRLWQWTDGWMRVVNRWATDRVLSWHDADKDSKHWEARRAAFGAH